ncbi:MAG: hypothetical protein JF625_23785 [Inquilinus limosus]|uniref:Uncharacterized protein n=1 Tax=Inquilinus limosus TaxID=171674 RepID=A0A952KFE0_9PROT|nr:hypothetical protein [Inquilinus limosus]
MSLMTGFPLVAHLMQIRLGGRFRHLPPSVAAELEAFAAEQDAVRQPATPKPAARRSSSVPSPAPSLALRKACCG